MKKILVLALGLWIGMGLMAQPTVKDPTLKAPLNRQLFHDNIDREQTNMLRLDGKADDTLKVSTINELNQQATNALVGQINSYQQKIEKDNVLKQNDKLRWLRAMEDFLQRFYAGVKTKQVRSVDFMDLLNRFETGMALEIGGKSILPIVRDLDFNAAKLLSGGLAFNKNVGMPEIKEILLQKYCSENPTRILQALKDNLNSPSTDSLLRVALYRSTNDFYTYASSVFSPIAKRMEKVPDSLMQLVVNLSRSKSGRLYFPFLDGLNKKTITTDEIDKVKDDSLGYFRLLVRTQINYAGRMLNKDTPLVHQDVTAMLHKKAVEPFVNNINGLHDIEEERIRFASIANFTPQELYYLIVSSEEEIYTSSYTNSFKRIFQRMKNPSADSLLLSVNMDRYRKFITMAANYNTLDSFLKRMPPENATRIMRAFASNLDKDTSLESATDVANAYASIKNKEVSELLKNQVASNLAMSKERGDKRAIAIYDILQNLFVSYDSTDKDLVSERYKMQPVLMMPRKQLEDTAKRVVMQMFFYGDKDGMGIFNSFLRTYSNANWKRVDKPEWVEISSTKGAPITIYANRALDELKGLDEKAQQALGNYLAENKIEPTIVVHRGHSYYLKYTVQQLAPSARIVVLGSCGAFHSLSTILDVCPDAHIVATKQIGTGAVNIKLIVLLTEAMRNGKDIGWPDLWKQLKESLVKDVKAAEKLEDYIPPHKNLGAIFLKAYTKVYAATEPAQGN
jgi:hypothetical protein